jgi:hypothetical protein
VKTHYELLGLEPSAGADAIKKAFRREIARYHPDKVIHLGAEFQELAATRAAELTVAYKTLTDSALRREYDVGIDAGAPPPHMPGTPRPQASAPAPAVPEPDHETLRRKSGRTRFAAERADSDLILKRAIASRVIAIVESLYGKVETPDVRGFDLAMVPIAKPRFLGSAPPRVLLKVLDRVDSGAMIEAFNIAARTRVHAGKSPVVVLLLSRTIAPQPEISKANEINSRHRKATDAPDEVAVVVVDTSDWSCRLPPNCSSAVRKLTDQICS